MKAKVFSLEKNETIFFFEKKKEKKMFLSNEKNLGFHMRYIFFLHYGCFPQNLGKEAVRTNMHTTVVCTPNTKIWRQV